MNCVKIFSYEVNRCKYDNELKESPNIGKIMSEETNLKESNSEVIAKPQISEDEFLKTLFDEGFITHIPEKFTDEDDDFEPIEIEGEPISETIIRDRGEY